MLRAMSAAFAAARRPRRLFQPDGRVDLVQFRVLLAGFAVLGGHVGVWAVLLADLTRLHSISPGQLGLILAATSMAGAVSSWLGGRISDRRGRRPLLMIGLSGVGLAFFLFAGAPDRELVVAAFLLAGLAGGCFDLSLNSLGGDYERRHGTKVMSGLHAAFSAGAALTAALTGVALAAGAGFPAVYAVYGGVLLAAAACFALGPLPEHRLESAATAGGRDDLRTLWTRGLLVAMALIGLTFMQDAVIEGFSAIYLQDALGAGDLLLGGGIAGSHAAVLAGRLASAVSVRRFGERLVLVGAGLGASLGLGVVVTAASPVAAVVGFLIVGVAVAPVAPLAFSLAARSAPGRVGQAVSAVSIVVYGAFIAGPLLAGALADTASLRLALLPLVLTSLLLAVVAAAGLRRQT